MSIHQLLKVFDFVLDKVNFQRLVRSVFTFVSDRVSENNCGVIKTPEDVQYKDEMDDVVENMLTESKNGDSLADKSSERKKDHHYQSPRHLYHSKNNRNAINQNNDSNNSNRCNNNNGEKYHSKGNTNNNALVELIDKVKRQLVNFKIDDSDPCFTKEKEAVKWRISAPTSLSVPSKHSDWKSRLNESRCSTSRWRHSSPDLRIPSCNHPDRMWHSKISKEKRPWKNEDSVDEWKFSVPSVKGHSERLEDELRKETKCLTLLSNKSSKDRDWTVSLCSIQVQNQNDELWVTSGS